MLVTLAKYKHAIAGSFLNLFIVSSFLNTTQLYGRSYRGHIDGDRKSAPNFLWTSNNDEPVSERNPILLNSNNRTPASNFQRDDNSAFRNAGPTPPETESFRSVNNSDMVDLFTGDFAYNIPLLNVGGYPINISYRGGISMDQEASWVGLGWSLNPGSINRNMRGLPDDFSGESDSITKTLSIRENKTIGVTAGAGAELVGLPLNLSASTGLFHNTYKGWGLEYGVNASINAGISSAGAMTAGLSITNNTQEGFTLSPTLSLQLAQEQVNDNLGFSGYISGSLPYNSRSGIKALELGAGIRQYVSDGKNQVSNDRDFSSSISFASPTYIPSISIPYTSKQYSFTAKVGVLKKVLVSNFFISGYESIQKVADADTTLSLPAFGYLNYQNANNRPDVLLDFNLEKDLPYHEKPPMPHIALPAYTYDAFSITGEGTGGMFRGYRNDIGFVHDHSMKTRDESDRGSLDLAFGDIVHVGVDLNVNHAYSQTGPWLENNAMQKLIPFKNSSPDFEAAYFRNPSEKSINSKEFYETVGGDDVVAVNLYQPSTSSSLIQATNYLSRYRNKRLVENKLLTPANAYKPTREKRTQVISYLTAKEAGIVGLSKYIESYAINQFGLVGCDESNSSDANGTGLPAKYYFGDNFQEYVGSGLDPTINFPHSTSTLDDEVGRDNEFSARWEGRIKAPETGTFSFWLRSDDGARLFLNGENFIDHWTEHPIDGSDGDIFHINLIAGQYYDIKIEYQEQQDKSDCILLWETPSTPSTFVVVPESVLYGLANTSIHVGSLLDKEFRVNSYRKPNHISEITVLNSDGRRYVYGIPVYNFKQRETTFAVNHDHSKLDRGLVAYSAQDQSTKNVEGIDNYFSSEEIPAYAESFLLSGVLSADYVDITGNGITDDDQGDAVKFNYSKTASLNVPFGWRVPYVLDSASYNEGLKTDNRDDKGSVVFGQKELWYLNSIVSKTMVATFLTEGRSDMMNINERGAKSYLGTARLKEINLYNKADFAKRGALAKPIKTVHFEYTYELCKGINKDFGDPNGKLTLKKIWFTYNNNNKGKQNPYLFFYSNNPDYSVKSYDRWGTYKKPSDNPSTAGTILNDEYPYAIQDSAAAARNASAWMLDSIALPSGGSIKPDFESDDYAFVQNKRAMEMVKPLGFSSSPSLTSGFSSNLYDLNGDYRYVYFSLPESAADKQDFFRKYLLNVQKVYFRLFVKMPTDQYGGGSEYVSGYADLDPNGGYGLSSPTIGWIKLSGISLKGDGEGSYSPMVKASLQFLRLNLPSKAYPFSEPGDNLTPGNAVKMILSSFGEIANAFSSFDRIGRNNLWCQTVDLNRSLFRLDNPKYEKYGGGHRVKRIKIYDNWNSMTGRRGAVYGQEYTYTTTKEVNGAKTTISSGVASYEPAIGGEENPFHQPIEYLDKSSILGPVTLGYSEEPLGETFFPSASVGYSRIRVRTINHNNVRSANGAQETQFYTSYDFPTYTDRTMFDENTKKRFKPSLANFLRINARHHIALSQGFKVELNDMNGKMKSEASFSEADLNHPFKYTENIYRTDGTNSDFKTLANQVTVIDPAGNIDSTAVIGKDVELMVAMRQQESISTGANVNVNVDVFHIPFIPFIFGLPSVIPLFQREENIFRSAAVTKVIQRYGILDHIIQVDKGSKIETENLVYDSETGDVVLSQTQNEFNDPVFNFNYPSHWGYPEAGPAYKNIDINFDHVKIKQGKIISGITNPTNYFSSGDEILVSGKMQTDQSTGCTVQFSYFPSFSKIWAIDKNILNTASPDIYFIGQDGSPYNGDDISMKIVRSGRKNVLTSIGGFTSLKTPLKYNGSNILQLTPDSSTQILNAAAIELGNFWRVDDRKKPGSGPIITNCRDSVVKGSTYTICDTTYGEGCFSVITDSTVNPYSAGILGNWRPIKNYVYFGPRSERDPSSQTNIRTDGTFNGFSPFWKFQSGSLQPQYDLTRWTWTEQKTMFNRKGFEIETKDPLGRYNSGLYGYNMTMPVAVTTNAKYRETGFDGFEDYGYITQACDTACSSVHRFDFSQYLGLIDGTRHHSGTHSLRLTPSNSSISLTFSITSEEQDTASGNLDFSMGNACSTTVLHSIKATTPTLIPDFSPSAGAAMILSAWVREDQDCDLSTYVNNRISITSTAGTTDFTPTGNIIEGWQRYECLFYVGYQSKFNITLHADNGVSVNFDDIRIHPFNANMKSYVFSPENLRIMAELDENNYATFYEYDDDGTLIRVKKETERGIKTIKETRTALIKE